MRLNEIKPNEGSRKVRLRVGRGASAGQGKTCGRGVKGQRAFGGAHALEGDGLFDLARQHDLGALGEHRNQLRGL